MNKFSKPQVTIDLEEYQQLKKAADTPDHKTIDALSNLASILVNKLYVFAPTNAVDALLVEFRNRKGIQELEFRRMDMKDSEAETLISFTSDPRNDSE